jgi:hypothetical protein
MIFIEKRYVATLETFVRKRTLPAMYKRALQAAVGLGPRSPSARCGGFALLVTMRYNEPDMTDSRLENLKRKRAQLNAKISKLSARAQAQHRREDTRRKIVAGAVLLAAVEDDRKREKPVGIARWWDAQLDQLSREQDRALFGLPSKGAAPAR